MFQVGGGSHPKSSKSWNEGHLIPHCVLSFKEFTGQTPDGVWSPLPPTLKYLLQGREDRLRHWAYPTGRGMREEGVSRRGGWEAG